MAIQYGPPSRNVGTGIRYAPAVGYNPAAYVPGGVNLAIAQATQNQGFGQPSYVAQGAYNPAAYVPGGSSPAVAQAIQSQGFGQRVALPTSGASGMPTRTLQGAGGPSLTAAQVANQRAQAQLDPQIAAQDAFNARQNAAISQFAQALMGKLQPFAGQIGQQYDTAIGQQSAIAGQSAQFLQNANPSSDVQALLQSVNAPASQQGQVSQQLSDTFGGGGAVLNYLGGQVPAQELLTDKTAAVGQAAQYPLLAGLQGGQDLSIALGQQTDARNQLLATRPALYQAALQDIRTNQANKAQLAQGAASLAETKREFNISAAPKVAAQKFVNWYRSTGYKLTPAQVNQAALRFGVVDASTLGSTSTSKIYSVTNTKSGSYVVNNTTGVAKLIPGSDTGTQGNWTVHDTKTGAVISNSKTGAVVPIPGTTPGAKTYPSKTINTPAGTIIFNPNDNSWTPIPGTAPPAKTQKPTIFGSDKGGYNALVPDGKGGWSTIPVKAADPNATPAAKPFHWSYKGRGYQFDPTTGKTTVLGGAPPSASGSGPKLNTTASGRYGIQIDTGGNPILRNGDTVPYPKTTTGATGPNSPSTHRMQTLINAINFGLQQAANGFDAKDINGKVVHHPALDRAGAIQELEKHGYFATPELKKLAMSLLNKVYPLPLKTVHSGGPLGVTATG